MLTESVHVRLSVSEKEAAKRLADADGRKVSNWIRKLILQEMARELRRLREQRS